MGFLPNPLGQINFRIYKKWQCLFRLKKIYRLRKDVTLKHPNQSCDEMKALQNIYCNFIKIGNEISAATIFTGYYNSRSSQFWENYIENWVCCIFSNFLPSNNLVELTNEPTHILDDSTQTCIDLIYTDQHYIFYRYRGLTNS